MNEPEDIVADADLRAKIGRRIAEYRERRELSQSQLGKLLRNSEGKPVAGTTISIWERGVYLPDRRLHRSQLADALHTSTAILFRELVPNDDALLADQLAELATRLDALISVLGIGDAVEATLRTRRRVKPPTTAPNGDLDAQEAAEAQRLAEDADLAEREPEQGEEKPHGQRRPTGT